MLYLENIEVSLTDFCLCERKNMHPNKEISCIKHNVKNYSLYTLTATDVHASKTAKIEKLYTMPLHIDV